MIAFMTERSGHGTLPYLLVGQLLLLQYRVLYRT